jgi:uncharacterized YigZ family protein
LPGSSFFVPEREAQAEAREKASRFFAFVFPVETAEQAGKKLADLKKKYFDASHVCFAWVIGTGKNEGIRSSDAGEPKGTAGTPILNAIRSAGLTNVLVAVVRHFGGTKLGTGGLSRAYRQAAAEALQKCGRKELWVTEEVLISVPLAAADRLLKLAERMAAEVKKKEFGAQMKAAFAVPVEKKEKFLAEVENLLRRAGG